MSNVVRVWDLPTRVFHWALVICVIALVVTGNIGGSAMAWHFRFGYAVFSLLLFRLVWGFVGGHWSRFVSFLFSPYRTWLFARGESRLTDSTGHNPLGAISVFAMLFLLLLQVGSGLISDDEISYSGPLAQWVSTASVALATTYHKGWGKTMILMLVGLHVASIVFYLTRKKQNLIGPMVSGDKILVAKDAPSSKDTLLTRLGALMLLGLCAAGVAWIVNLPS